MFTGLIEHLAHIVQIDRDDGGCKLTIGGSAQILSDCHVGDSIAVNGACLTVTEFDAAEVSDGGWFSVWLANETLSRTELGDKKVGDMVNLERAMDAHVRFGGHFVQAHVDTTATIINREPDGDSIRITFELALPTPTTASVMQYIVPKGYIALDGASLTITHVDDSSRTFGVMLIQHTQERITLGTKKEGEKVNVEVDMVGKYVEKSVIAALGGGGGQAGINVLKSISIADRRPFAKATGSAVLMLMKLFAETGSRLALQRPSTTNSQRSAMSKFLAKLVNKNNQSQTLDVEGRARTISDIGPVRSRTVSAIVTDTKHIPSFTLTSENGDSPVQPPTPGSLHRSNSKGSGGDSRIRSESLSVIERKSSNSSLTPITGTASRTSTAQSGSSSTTAVTGLGIDLGDSVSASTTLPSSIMVESASAPTGINKLRHKLSSKSIKSQHKSSPLRSESSLPHALTSELQEVALPDRSKSLELVDSPKSEGNINDNTPTTASFVPSSEGAPTALSPALSTVSAKSGFSLQASSIADSDAASIASANKKRTWRAGSTNSKKRNPTGLASAIASSGLAMANPGVTQQLQQQFVPPPMPPNSPPRTQDAHTPKRSFSGGSNRPKSTSNASRTRVNGVNGLVAEDGFDTDDTESDEGLDLDDVPVTGFAVASNKRNQDFHEMFQSVPEGDYLIEDYGCALQREILIQGRIYISENHICFHANIFGWVTDLIVPVQEIQSIEKRMTALFIPNAIQITTRTAKYTFASFLSRDTTFDVIQNVWNLAKPDNDSMFSASSQPLQDPNIPTLHEGVSETSRSPTGLGKRPTACECALNGTHYSSPAMEAVFSGTPEKIYNLMFTSEFIKDFLRNDQNLKDLQISDWIPDSSTSLLTRKFSYIKILNGIVKQTKCELTDTMRHCNFEEYVSMDTSTRTPDVPSGGVFEVRTRTCIMWAGPASSKVVVTTQVEWTGRSFIKSLITSASIDGQKQYHKELETAMRKYIAEHKTEFVPEGVDVVDPVPVAVEEKREDVAGPPPLSTEEASKRREQERNQRATQWAFDTVMGAYKVAKTATLDALDLVGDAWDQSSSTTILYFAIVVLVLTNIWTFLMVGRREEVGRRKEMIKMEEQKKWVSSIVVALHEEQALHQRQEKEKSFVDTAVPTTGADFKVEVSQLMTTLDAMEDRIQKLKNALNDLD